MIQILMLCMEIDDQKSTNPVHSCWVKLSSQLSMYAM